MSLDTWDRKAADALADEVAVLVRRKVIDSRSPAADALLDYREPPSTPRVDRIVALAERVVALERSRARLLKVLEPFVSARSFDGNYSVRHRLEANSSAPAAGWFDYVRDVTIGEVREAKDAWEQEKDR